MENYIGIKQIKAKPMNHKEYTDYIGWELLSNESREDEGYLVEYIDGGLSNHPNHSGYISWSPKDVFDKAYRKTTGLTFGLALEAVKQGKLIAREGWNGKGMFVFQRPEDYIAINTLVHIVSLPESVKGWFAKQTYPNKENRLDGTTQIKFTGYLCMKAADGSIVNGWLASQTDMLAEDWTIVE